MAVSESSRNALLPSFLYAVPAAATTTTSSPFSSAAGLGGHGIVAPTDAAATRPAVRTLYGYASDNSVAEDRKSVV